jgi:hypothetical protein
MPEQRTLAEQVVLLTLGGSPRRIARALRVAGLPSLREVNHRLQIRGLVTRGSLIHHAQVSPAAPMRELRRRLTQATCAPATGSPSSVAAMASLRRYRPCSTISLVSSPRPSSPASSSRAAYA